MADCIAYQLFAIIIFRMPGCAATLGILLLWIEYFIQVKCYQLICNKSFYQGLALDSGPDKGFCKSGLACNSDLLLLNRENLKCNFKFSRIKFLPSTHNFRHDCKPRPFNTRTQIFLTFAPKINPAGNSHFRLCVFTPFHEFI